MFKDKVLSAPELSVSPESNEGVIYNKLLENHAAFAKLTGIGAFVNSAYSGKYLDFDGRRAVATMISSEGLGDYGHTRSYKFFSLSEYRLMHDVERMYSEADSHTADLKKQKEAFKREEYDKWCKANPSSVDKHDVPNMSSPGFEYHFINIQATQGHVNHVGDIDDCIVFLKAAAHIARGDEVGSSILLLDRPRYTRPVEEEYGGPKNLKKEKVKAVLDKFIAITRREVLHEHYERQFSNVVNEMLSNSPNADGPDVAAFDAFFTDEEKGFYNKPMEKNVEDAFKKDIEGSLRYRFLSFLRLNAPDLQREKSIFARAVVAVVGLFIDTSFVGLYVRIRNLAEKRTDVFVQNEIKKQSADFSEQQKAGSVPTGDAQKVEHRAGLHMSAKLEQHHKPASPTVGGDGPSHPYKDTPHI
ncbi:MAG: hypothetical protein V4490_05455 [Pseudomonadota bacterium]